MRTVLNQIECTESGLIQLRIKKVVAEGVFEYHRAALEPGGSVDDLAEAVNRDLASMGFPAIAPEDVARVQRIAAVEHTPDMVQRFTAMKAAVLERLGVPPA